MPKCNMDCLNCIYDDCILDKGYTTTTRYDAREYHRLYRRYMYYARHDFYLEYERKRCELKRKLLLTKNKKHTLSKEEKNHINLINKKYKNKKKNPITRIGITSILNLIINHYLKILIVY